ncbi:MAG: hypothetical protein ACP5D2_03310, partial [Candidatus Nanoarchaeia archaeon]
MDMKRVCLLLILLLPVISAASYSLDINFNKQEYAIGENITYEVILFENGQVLDEMVNVTFSDYLEKKVIEMDVMANEKHDFLVEDDFLSGYW